MQPYCIIAALVLWLLVVGAEGTPFLPEMEPKKGCPYVFYQIPLILKMVNCYLHERQAKASLLHPLTIQKEHLPAAIS